MQQAGATPAEAMAFTLSLGDPVRRRLRRRGAVARRLPAALHVLLRHLALVLRGDRQVPRRPPHLGAPRRASATARRDPRSWRFKFHAQTSGVDLTRQQPLNNIARVTAQAIAGIFGGLQSLHTDAYDEALSCPTQFGARIAVATQNILREEAHLTDVIDPLGGSYYVEALTDEMEERVLAIMADVEAAGGMYTAVESGFVQRRIGESARALPGPHRQRRADGRGRQRLPGRRGRQRAPCPAEARRRADGRASRGSSRSGRRSGRSDAVAQGAGRSRARRASRPRDNMFAQRRRGGGGRLHARRDLRHAAARAGLRHPADRRASAMRDSSSAAAKLSRSAWRPIRAGDRATHRARDHAKSRTSCRPRRRCSAALRRQAGRAHVVGITGPPGAGKSTLINALLRRARRRAASAWRSPRSIRRARSPAARCSAIASA